MQGVSGRFIKRIPRHHFVLHISGSISALNLIFCCLFHQLNYHHSCKENIPGIRSTQKTICACMYMIHAYINTGKLFVHSLLSRYQELTDRLFSPIIHFTIYIVENLYIVVYCKFVVNGVFFVNFLSVQLYRKLLKMFLNYISITISSEHGNTYVILHRIFIV